MKIFGLGWVGFQESDPRQTLFYTGFAVIVPYYCAMGNETIGWLHCATIPETIDVKPLINQTMKYESDGLIDSTSNLRDDRVYIYHGKNDTVVLPGQSTVGRGLGPPMGWVGFGSEIYTVVLPGQSQSIKQEISQSAVRTLQEMGDSTSFES